jgi:hypothetical protein
MLVDQVLEGGFLNCVMVITPSRAYVTAESSGYFNGAPLVQNTRSAAVAFVVLVTAR